ncbi:glycosyltransferase family 4 protein [Branchiibius sp. NY16-3462-2]|uniref:glycosyltransferase family 4 protein n=1 Tax=Branchiibius sp. NY16-3462-2 TaxID=1807500 RepID=UPI00079271A5|nr:glycosyltransferase family 4 protein [Branchiibius sp. NY16-3462-2]KYH45867.1 hypothetical protein AZH51_09275 [Branchiibius sp. NY16-3462-2]
MFTHRRRRLLFIHSSDELYGADRVLLDQILAIPNDVDVEVWLPDDLEHGAFPLCHRLEELGVSVHHLPLPIMRRAYQTPTGLLRLSARSASLVQRLHAHRPDVVYCTTSATFLAAPAARLAQIPHVIGHVHEMWSDMDRRILGPLARHCGQLLAISNAVVESLPPALRDRTVIVPNGTADPGTTQPVAGGIGPVTYLVASRWNAWKGYATLLEAWRHVSEARLIVLGAAPPSGASTDVRALAAEVDHPETIEIVGEVEDISPYLERADVMIVPSEQPEPFGLVAIEAFARSRPVLASAAGGLLDIVTAERDGWFFPPGDAAALADLLKRIDRAEVARTGTAARATFEARFTSERYAADWWDLVNGVSGLVPPAPASRTLAHKIIPPATWPVPGRNVAKSKSHSA